MREICVVLAPPNTGEDRLTRAVAALERRGFELFVERRLDGAAHSRALTGVVCADCTVLICFAPLIEAEDPPGERFAHPSVDNAAFHLGATLGPAADSMKVAATERQAMAIMDAVLTAEELSTLRERIALRRDRMKTTEPVLTILSRHRHRAKVELVEWQGRKALKKTFRATATQAMANEIAFHDDIAPHSLVPARILNQTDTALYEHIPHLPASSPLLGLSLPQLLPLTYVTRLSDFVRLITARG